MPNKIYLSDKITNGGTEPYQDAELRFARLEQIAIELGLEPVNPLKLELDHTSWESEMQGCIKALLPLPAILMGFKWQLSSGARMEKVIAQAQGKFIIDVNELGYRF